MKHLSTGGSLFLVGTLFTAFLTTYWYSTSDQEGCPICANVPLWPG